MNRKKLTGISISVAMLMTTGSAQAASWTAGAWELSLGGNINANFMITQCSDNDLGAGGGTMSGLACAGSVDENGSFTDAQSIQNGLLPAALNFSAKTTQDDWDLAANINVYYGINSNDGGGADALKFSSVDARQIFVTASKKDGGEFKFGRDFGLFGFDAIIADMSLVGSGANFLAQDPGHTTLGGLGFGYVYTDRLAQINYTTADMSGFKGTVGLFQPFDGKGANSSGDIGIHAKGSYSRSNYTVSATFLSQGVNTTAGTSEDITGFDLFFKIDIGALGLVAYYYDAEGMSSLAIGGLIFPGFDTNLDADGNVIVGTGTGAPEETSGTMLQATYQATPKLKLGINLSQSEQEEVTLVENDRLTLGAYYNVTSSLMVLAEFNSTESDLNNVGTDEVTSINVGAFFGF